MVFVSTATFKRTTRPPTPPTDSAVDIEEALEYLTVDYSTRPATNGLVQVISGIDTPPQNSSPTLSATSKEKAAKKVDFSPWPAENYDKENGGTSVLKRLPSSRDLRPRKSILKSTAQVLTPSDVGSPAPDYFSIGDPATFPKMLESVVKQLAAASPMSRLDGYRTMNGALKAFQDLPDKEDLKAKMTLLEQFIKRDLTTKTPGHTDTTMITQALKLATALTTIPAVAAAFSDDFQITLVDRAIEVMGEDGVVKAVANHYMYLLAFQKFGVKAMTASKAEQIIIKLESVHDRVSGNSVAASRMVIYQRLIDQAPGVMLTRIKTWVKPLFHALMSSNNDIRGRAIEFGTHAALALGTHQAASKAIVDLFETEVKDGGVYGDFLAFRLLDMIRDKEKSHYVPRIWSLVILFFRSKKRMLTQWNMFRKHLLLIIQKCLNSSDLQTKYQATIAWNRLVFVVHPDQSTLDSKDVIVPMLKVPFTVAFEKKGDDRHSNEARSIANSGYCNLLHYALRPTQSHEELDSYWSQYAEPILGKLLSSGKKDTAFACRILKALFQGNTTVWNPNRANEPKPMGPEDLSRLDAKWLRSRFHKMLALLEPYIRARLSLPSEAGRIEATPWHDLLSAVAEAGSQEVRASQELREAVAQLLNFARRVWTAPMTVTEEASGRIWITRYRDLLLSAIDTLGALHFGEEMLSRSQADTLEAAPTPSHRSSKHHEVLQTPVVLLFEQFLTPPAALSADRTYYEAARSVLHSVCGARPTTKSKLVLLRHCLPIVTPIPRGEMDCDVGANLWNIIAAETNNLLQQQDSSALPEHLTQLGFHAKHVVSVFGSSFAFSNSWTVTASAARRLYHTMAETLRSEGGEAALIVGLMEPVAESLLNAAPSMSSSAFVACATTVLSYSASSQTRQQVEIARRLLFDSTFTNVRHALFEPFDHLYKLINTVCGVAYAHVDECRKDLSRLVSAIHGFLSDCPTSLATLLLRRTQAGIALLVQDGDRKLASEDEDLMQTSARILTLWQLILKLGRNTPANSLLLRALEDLFAAGLGSSRRAIVNETIEYWNDSFGMLDTLDYPPKVEAILRRLQSVVELDLPTFPDSGHQDEALPALYSQEFDAPKEQSTPRARTSWKTAASSTPRPRPMSNDRRHLLSTPVSARGGPLRQSTPGAHLRHNDSQIQFVPVDSLPVPSSDIESQDFTEHQKEVQNRQLEAAQMYPEFSSSPVPKSSTSKSLIHKLEFAARNVAVDPALTTPDPLHDEHDPMDDFLTSSPTPRTAAKFRMQEEANSEVEHEAEHLPHDMEDDQDLPSSPPEAAEADGAPDQAVPDLDVDMQDAVAGAVVDDQPAEGPGDAEERAHEVEQVPRIEEERPVQDTTYLEGSTTEVPTEFQTSLEEASAQQQVEEHGQNEPTDQVHPAPQSPIDNAASADSSSSPLHFSESLEDVPAPEVPTVEDVDDPEVKELSITVDVEASRVQDSVVETPAAISRDSTPLPDLDAQDKGVSSVESKISSQQSDEKIRKRKRSSEVVYASTTKRRKQTSPLKRFYTALFGGSQDQAQAQEQEDDENVEDCIVVASQPEFGSTIDMMHQDPERFSAPPEVMEPPKTKRRPGRPPKSTVPRSSSPVRASLNPRGKRRASAMNEDVSMVEETPAPSKAHKQRAGQDISTVQTPEPEKKTVEPHSQTRIMQAVVIPATDINRDEYEEYGGTASPERQIQAEAAAAQSPRKIAKPKSIMARLKGILAECKNLVLGSQEEREMDDVLFAMRREVFEAARRGRDE